MGLQQFERRLERLVEGVFARAFRSGLQPVELGRRLTREMDLRRTVAPRGTLTPNRFTVAALRRDRARFAPIEDELVDELVDVARDHARSRGLRLPRPGRVDHRAPTPTCHPGMLLVSGEMVRRAKRAPAALVLPDGRRVALGQQAGDHRPPPRLPGRARRPQREPAPRRGPPGRPTGAAAIVVIDLGSTNGTKVNGVGDRAATGLQHGDEIVRRRPPGCGSRPSRAGGPCPIAAHRSSS